MPMVAVGCTGSTRACLRLETELGDESRDSSGGEGGVTVLLGTPRLVATK